MFIESVNAAFINKLFTYGTISPMHSTVTRLLAAARAATNNDGLTLAQVTAALDATAQVMNNWKGRGISKEGALKAESVYGCSAQWLLTGKGPAATTAPAPSIGKPAHARGERVDFSERVVSESQWAILQDIEVLPEEERSVLVADLRERGSKYRTYVKEIEERMRSGALGRQLVAAEPAAPHGAERSTKTATDMQRHRKTAPTAPAKKGARK